MAGLLVECKLFDLLIDYKFIRTSVNVLTRYTQTLMIIMYVFYEVCMNVCGIFCHTQSLITQMVIICKWIML